MKIKRTFAPDIRQAIRLVREQQGEDAVILGNRQVPGGVEIMSAIDFDEDALFAQDAQASTSSDSDQTGELPAIADSHASQELPDPYLNPAKQASKTRPNDADHCQPQSQTANACMPAAPAGRADLAPARTAGQRSAAPSVRSAARVNRTPGTGRPAVALNRAASRAARRSTPVAQAAHALSSTAPNGAPIQRRNPSVGTGIRRALCEAELTKTQRSPRPINPESPGPASQTGRRAGISDADLEALLASVATPSKSADPLPPGIDSMHRELRQLRGLMENQFSVMQWEQMTQRHPARIALVTQLSDLGLGSDLVQSIAAEINEPQDMDRAWRKALALLAKRLPISDDDPLTSGGAVAVVGPTGVGKTTTIAKLAARFVMQYGKRHLALVSTDTFRLGAQEQLLSFARILDVPLHTVRGAEELSRVLAGLYDKTLVLIDTAGMSQHDMRLNEQFTTLYEGSPLIKTYLAISANTQLAALDEVVRAFGRVHLTGCVITKLDEAGSLGGALTVAVRHQLPITYLGVGQRVPEDLQPARAHRLVSHAVPMGDRHIEQADQEALAVRYAGAVSSARH